MKLAFPSCEFDEAVAAVCHGSASDEQMRGLNELLRSDSVARDQYILRLELHSRLDLTLGWIGGHDDSAALQWRSLDPN